MIRKNWRLRDPAPDGVLAQYNDVSPIIAQLLYNRGLQTPEDVYHFLYDKEITLDPFEMKDMQKAVDRLSTAIKSGEAIVVYGDFDADGVTATTLLMSVLKRLNANVRAYIPHRVDEGYGLNSEALETLAAEGASLVVTVDCGIRAVDEVLRGNAAGLDIIVTDHHSVGPEIPPAYAVVNPQQEDCNGDTDLAGVGVAFMVARALLLDAWKRLGRKPAHLRKYKSMIDELLDLVAIGTVADIMPLNAPVNRSLVRKGLNVINRTQRPGLQALMDVAGIKSGQANAMSIGFGLGPRINAAGRLESALTAYQLLSADDADDAAELAAVLQQLNERRRKLTREAQARVRSQIEDDGMEDADLIFAVDDHVSPGIVGLVAGRITEEFYRPAVVVERGETECHASCRSIPDFHITRALDECADLLVRHGGHAMAAGLTVRPENLPHLRERLQAKAREQLGDRTLRPTIEIDMKLDMRDISMNLAEELLVLEPTGHHNSQPIFLTHNLEVLESRTVGSDGGHLKLKVGSNGAPSVDAIGFRLGDRHTDLPACIDAVYHLEINEWRGRRNVQLNLLDIRPAGESQ